MKTKYKILLWIIGAEFVLLWALKEYGVVVDSWVGKLVGVFVVFFPVQFLLFSLGKDEDFLKKKRFFFKFAFWWINFCCVAGLVATFVWPK